MAEIEVVLVTLAGRRKARVKVVRDRTDRLDQDRRWQAHPQRREQALRAVPPREVKVEHLPAGVHARIRATARVNANQPLREHPQARLDHVLQAGPARLALPTGERGAVIGTHRLPALNRDGGLGRVGSSGLHSPGASDSPDFGRVSSLPKSGRVTRPGRPTPGSVD